MLNINTTTFIYTTFTSTKASNIGNIHCPSPNHISININIINNITAFPKPATNFFLFLLPLQQQQLLLLLLLVIVVVVALVVVVVVVVVHNITGGVFVFVAISLTDLEYIRVYMLQHKHKQKQTHIPCFISKAFE